MNIKRSFLWITTILALSIAENAQSASAPQCPYTADYLKAQLGQPFATGVPEKGIIGKACSYKAGNIKVWIDAGAMPTPTAEMWRKMATAPGTQWQVVKGDPDKAVHEIPPKGISRYPALSYERAGWLVNIVVTGVDNAAATQVWNSKLLKLRRIP